MIRTGRCSPLRYPGGKGKLSRLVKAIVEKNKLLDGTYVEPFAGGAGVACELLIENYVRQIHINDVSPAIFAFWQAMLNQTDLFCTDIVSVPLTVEEWDRQKEVFETQRKAKTPNVYLLGFATFYLNRTNRSGILNGGIIGGRSQASEWGIDARFNRHELVSRVRLLGGLRKRITVTNLDALALLSKYRAECPPKTLMYLDPPYYAKGRQLYLDYYKPSDHQLIADEVQKNDQPFDWMVSYDNVQPIKKIYAQSQAVEYNISYSARRASTGSEVIFFGPRMRIPEVASFIAVTKAA